MLTESFVGLATILIAVASYSKVSRFHLNDINKPLMSLWQEIINDPQGIAVSYERLWVNQQDNPRRFYSMIMFEMNCIKPSDQITCYIF